MNGLSLALRAIGTFLIAFAALPFYLAGFVFWFIRAAFDGGDEYAGKLVERTRADLERWRKS